MKKAMKKIAKQKKSGRTLHRAATLEKSESTQASVSTRRKEESGLEDVAGQLRIRMYRVGFGDFFLLSVPAGGEHHHIVIDCGVTRGKTGKGDIGTIKDAAADMLRETQGKLALVIVTHRHMDHIIGFSRCQEFQSVKVDSIWMPVWETEYDSNISSLQEELSALALDVQTHLAAVSDGSEESNEMLAMLENAVGDLGVAGTGGGSNKASLKLLKEGMGVKPQYYSKGQQPRLPKVLADAGLTAEILGPPPIDAKQFVKLKDLKKGVGQYLDAAAAIRTDSKKFRPFRNTFEYKPDEYEPEAFREWWTRDPAKPKNPRPWEALQSAVDEAQPAVLLTAVKQLDAFLNNQSLVVLFTFRGKKLLFAGDAQAGNWEYWLYDGDTPTKSPSDKLGEQGAAVLGHLDFYKVGHHGSTNATPIAAVNAMNGGFVSMCSTQADSFGSVENKSEVPRIPLIEALAKKSAIVRSDQIQVTIDGKPAVPPVKDSPAELPTPEAGKLVPGACYIDYFL
jgi:beta-lactamase superfamily II metal-dependent hydrolase